MHLDVTDPAEWTEAVKSAEARLGAVSVLVNNAGISHSAMIEETDPAA